MANLALVTTGKLNVVESIVQKTLPLAESIDVGQAVRLDTTNGKWTKANATAAGEARVWGVLVSKDGAGAVGTAVKKGTLDGFDLGALAYDAPIYLSNTDGTFADAAGTVSVVAGRVVPGTSNKIADALDKLFEVDL